MDDARVISVIMPAYKVERFIGEALASVAAQTWHAIELIAIDDGSPDSTGEILDREARAWTGPLRRMVVIQQANAGAGAARNAGLARATGDFVAFMDADDRLHSDAFARLVATLDSEPGLDMTFPQYRFIDEDGASLGYVSRIRKGRLRPADLMIDNPVDSATGVLLRAGAARATGPVDETLTGCIDQDFWVRLAALRPGNVRMTPEILADYRKRAGQITSDWRRMAKNWGRVCDKAEAAGYGLTPRQRHLARARHCVHWSGIAYKAGQFRDARRLIGEAWLRDPLFVARDGNARIRTAACLTSLLPASAHDYVRRSFEASRQG